MRAKGTTGNDNHHLFETSVFEIQNHLLLRNMSEPLFLKQQLFEHCDQKVRQQIADLEAALASVEESRNNETKSSVGDKYETGRAMMQQEEEKYRTQLANALHLKRVLEQIDPERRCARVEAGSLVITSAGRYFISIGLGKIRLDDGLYYAISTEAPVSRELLGKSPGDIIYFNQKQIEILDIS
ncbi:3-oxoacyl-ACP synthase [Flavilitoribacter nigricans DSM 23189 = NBRC 102662]|uniref:3-oxoacyl-ACP synthase n=2 Tax=Flavilitoribacter TaxID=2762562 RepID=A0A2D0N1B7_FLAN2|nr:3-oxoacyl-ACP synthase [Flavilitoribacter nigricans DSM 23189 = NBRC 102662]